MSLAWIEREWCSRRPSIEGDEFMRRTFVLPWPVAREIGEGGDPMCRALVLVISPWWATRQVFDPTFRAYVRWLRGYYRALYAVWDPDAPDGEEVWNQVYDEWEPLRPPTPRGWSR
jgi:hypothetical protein